MAHDGGHAQSSEAAHAQAAAQAMAEPGTPAWQAAVATLARPLGELPDPLPIPRVGRAFDVRVRPPGSKSLTNRAILLAALADGESTLTHALVDADDAQVMVRALRALGAGVEIDGSTVRVRGVGGRWRVGTDGVTINLNNAGTATRFLTAAAVLAPAGSGGIVIDGNARMRERPIRELGDALARLGVRVEYLGGNGCPPLRVHPPADGSALARTIEFGTTASSQFISAVMLVAPLLPGGLRVISRDPVTSPSYIAMTRALMGRVGVRVESGGEAGCTLDERIGPQAVRGFTLDIEPDASGATYFEAAAALVPGARCAIDGLDLSPTPGAGSMQGDARFVGVISAMAGAVERLGTAVRVTGGPRLVGVDADLSDMPDTAMTAAVLACFADGPTTLRGLRTLRVKETDRLEALRVELGRLGAGVRILPDVLHGEADEALEITPPSSGGAGSVVAFDTYDDHRMAMALALVGLRRGGVLIREPACVRKTYPTFFQELARLYA